jgi:sugar diacid utilization regulator
MAMSVRAENEFEVVPPIIQAIITSLDPDVVLRTLVQKIRELEGVHAAAVFEHDESCSRLKVRCSSGLSESYTRFIEVPVGGLAVGRAFQKGDVVVASDVSSDPAFAPPVRRRMHREDLEAVLAAPLVAQDRLLGVLAVYFDRPFSKEEYDTSIIRTLANLAAVALHNAGLFQAQLRATQELESLSRRLSEQSEMLRKSAEIHEWLVQTVLACDGLDAVTGALARLAHAMVVVEDIRLNVISLSCPEANRPATAVESDGLGLARFRADPRVQQHLARMRMERRPRLLPAIPEIGLAHTRITMPSFVGDSLLAFVSIIVAPDRSLGQLDYVLSEQGAIAIALELMKGRAAFDAEQRLRGDFLQCLLAGRIEGLRDSSALMAASGFDLATLQRVMVIRSDEKEAGWTDAARDGSQITRRSQICGMVENLVTGVCPRSMVVASKEGFTVLLGSEQRIPESVVRDLAQRIVSSVAEYLEPTTVSVGIGGACQNLGDVGRSFNEANRAHDIGSILHRRSFVISCSDLGVFELLFRQGKLEELREFSNRYIGSLTAYDRRHGGGLVQTLENYVRRNYCLNETAEDLHLHPNSVKYRLRKIEELCGVDLRNSEDLMNLQVALRLHRLIA